MQEYIKVSVQTPLRGFKKKKGYKNQSVFSLMLGKIEARRRGQQGMRWLDGITDSRDTNLSKLQEIVKNRGADRKSVV